MHLLASQPGGFSDDEGIIDLGQTPGELVILSAADSVLALLAERAEALPDAYPSVRLANWLNLKRPAALDLYRDRVTDRQGPQAPEGTRLMVLSLLGGESYWQYGLEQCQAWAQETGGILIVVPGEDYEDEHLLNAGSVDYATAWRVWRYLREGGRHNVDQLYRYLATLAFDHADDALPPSRTPRALLYQPQATGAVATLDEWRQRWQPNAPVAVLVFYRSHLQNANVAMFDALIETMIAGGLNPLPIAVASLKEPLCLETVDDLIEQANADIMLNATGFALSGTVNASLSSTPSDYRHPFQRELPILQVILASNSEADWREQSAGLRSRDIAMHIALPELDGRIITRAVGFKSGERYSTRTQHQVIRYELHAERARFVVELARRWAELRRTPASQKRIALILANYPSSDGRIGNGVGLDTPASTLNILHALREAGYAVGDTLPQDATALIEWLQASVTNEPASWRTRPAAQSLDMTTYRRWFATLPEQCQQAVLVRWGEPEQDPRCRQGRLMIAGMRLGETFIGVQPERGYDIDEVGSYHAGDLVPTHAYLAFYCWLREVYSVDAVIHVGKHGNLEWLPGKSTALSETCWPDIALGPMPHLYPFIVNDPGEGAQAKRRSQAVIIDHLMPPMTRAGVHGELAELERLTDEYYQALGLDQRREQWLRRAIVDQLKNSDLLAELEAMPASDGRDGALEATLDEETRLLNRLDGYLCEIKEAQIRHGLHRLGQLPDADRLTDMLLSLMRLPRGDTAADAGILHALRDDLALDHDLDPLDSDTGPWSGPSPKLLQQVLPERPWKTRSHTRERLEALASQLVESHLVQGASLTGLPVQLERTHALLESAQRTLLPVLNQSVDNELSALLDGLAGRFVAPGPSGAPTRGRLDVLPTGRNFYAVDSRAIPSRTAWQLGQQSAEALIERHLQEHGDYPASIGLSVWGTATMRTGGDDIAQAMALMGVRPVWAPGSQRVVDFEVIPIFLLGRPRVDVTLRVSGFFRDAFPNLIRLFDAAVQKLAELEEPGDNPIRHHVEERQQALMTEGHDRENARLEAGYRVFGTRPGSYGAGLQSMLDEGHWENSDDLARAWIDQGSFAYGQADFGTPASRAFTQRLGQLDAVVHNQDNREHDLLDSGDYARFQGGMANAVRSLCGKTPSIYHGDHANPARPKVRTLKEELNRVIRARVTNPKWIAGMQRHGYKGAFEMAASVDYLFAYDATTGLIDDYQYASVTEALALEPENREFMAVHNPHALKEMAERLLEAIQRGLWESPGNYRQQLEALLIDLDVREEQAAS
ncbi:cobaltochelatase subunit CobN [Kushneria phosphatilytica]|uniref:Cobaltochelatase subunit CobN n=1 Tax=Kushneria phosphatilytica TaxID=657387 RepID=A0A1S1NWC8_9GAMM|nr:cobaltochelatase subunit CobN [Kushneria phosphatilytica]OHV11870.1 cobaltochelatase subunit CobN [Kushneria phosphatilytica]QEL11043.1 cobaltochelatase subunit CobN [Kushneria phosphatilytica]